jgi:hypothetical protein
MISVGPGSLSQQLAGTFGMLPIRQYLADRFEIDLRKPSERIINREDDFDNH